MCVGQSCGTQLYGVYYLDVVMCDEQSSVTQLYGVYYVVMLVGQSWAQVYFGRSAN